MLKRLYIKNFAIVDELEINFDSGFQVITGETGAGKSILVGAIGLLCGDRGNVDVVRSGMQKAIMEGEFQFSDGSELRNLLARHDIDFNNDTIILRREINDRGISRAFVNDSPVNISVLAQLSDYLIDLHGQHHHQRLLRPETHVEYLDAYGQLEPDVADYQNTLNSYRTSVQTLFKLKMQHSELVEKQDLYAFQIDELEKAEVRAGEYADLDKERRILENSELLYEKAKSVADQLYNLDDSVLHAVTNSASQLKHMAEIDEKFSLLLENLENARVTIQDIGLECEQYCTHMEFDPNRLEEIRNRQSQLDWLIKKYQVQNADELVAHLDGLKNQVTGLESYEQDITAMENQIGQTLSKLQDMAGKLNNKRTKIAREFETQMNAALQAVGLLNARFEIDFSFQVSPEGEIEMEGSRCLLNDRGADIIEFQVGLNVGEPVKPLHKVASGGEVSRIMLCIKSLLAESDNIDSLVFDEIDNGISGKFAQIVGKKMQEMSRQHQLIVITHLPQIAAQGKEHFSVHKYESNGRTQVQVNKLDLDQRIEDIAKLLGGEQITAHARANARELLAEIT